MVTVVKQPEKLIYQVLHVADEASRKFRQLSSCPVQVAIKLSPELKADLVNAARIQSCGSRPSSWKCTAQQVHAVLRDWLKVDVKRFDGAWLELAVRDKHDVCGLRRVTLHSSCYNFEINEFEDSAAWTDKSSSLIVTCSFVRRHLPVATTFGHVDMVFRFCVPSKGASVTTTPFYVMTKEPKVVVKKTCKRIRNKTPRYEFIDGEDKLILTGDDKDLGISLPKDDSVQFTFCDHQVDTDVDVFRLNKRMCLFGHEDDVKAGFDADTLFLSRLE